MASDPSRAPRLLVADEDPATRALLALLLGAEGYRVETVAALDEAAPHLAAPADLIVADGCCTTEAAFQMRAPAILAAAAGPPVVLAVDDVKRLGEEEMKVTLDGRGRMARITKVMPPAQAYGEYIGATLIDPAAAAPLAAALEQTWRRDPQLYYEDGYQTFVDAGGEVAVAPIGEVSWVEVDDHADLARAREIACHY